MKRTVTPEKAENIFASLQSVAVLVELISIELRNDLHDHRLNNANLNNHVKRIKESTAYIKASLKPMIDAKDREYFEFEHCAALSSLFNYFTTMPMEAIEDTLNHIEELKKQVA